jgi:cytochrome c biogenesis protein CcmG, thiol:disulfide interchange protein DsbE
VSDDRPTASPTGAHPSTLGSGARRRGPRWGVLTAVGCSVAVLGSVFAFGLSRDPSIVMPVNIGARAPDFASTTLDGTRTVRLSSLRGQVVVLNFWASWCAECLVEHPALSQAWDRYRDQGVVVLGMDFDDAHGAATAFASRLGVSYPLLSDPGDRTALAFGVSGPPETFLIGRDGVIEGKTIGPVGFAGLSAEIQTLLAGAAG